MKKTYSKPETRTHILSIKTAILQSSPGLKSTGYDAGRESLSRRSTSWDDEEEE